MKKIWIEERENPAASLASLWPDYPQPPKTYKVFVRDYTPRTDLGEPKSLKTDEVDCDYIARKYGEATVENAILYFDLCDSTRDEDEKEILEADNA